MTTYSTGNPIGSTSPKDLYDNAENLDVLLLDQEKLSHPDRLGVPRWTWHGIEQRFAEFLANSGYQFLADYEPTAGIEITEYNQVLRDSTGNLWRLDPSVPIPYTTDGSGMPEGGAFLSVGDADLRQDLANGDAQVSSSTGAQSISEALDSRAAKQEVTLTVNIPTDYSTLQEAIDDLSTLSVKHGAIIDLVIESGHSPSSGVSVSNGSYNQFRISSQDPEVLITSAIESSFLYVNNALGPILNTLIDGNSLLFRGCYYIEGAIATITPGSGVRNVRERGLYVNNSRVSATGCDFSGAGQDGTVLGRALWASRCADIVAESADFTGCMGTSTSVYMSRRSNVHAPYWSVSCPNGNHAVWVHRGSTLNAQEGVVISGGNTTCVNATRGSTVILNGTQSIEGMTQDGVVCSGGSTVNIGEGVNLTPSPGNNGRSLYASSCGRIDASDVNIGSGFESGPVSDGSSTIDMGRSTHGAVSGSVGVHATRGGKVSVANSDILTSSAPNDLRVTQGGQIIAHGSNTTNSGGSGSPTLSDTWADGRGGFNAFISGGAGIIWA